MSYYSTDQDTKKRRISFLIRLTLVWLLVCACAAGLVWRWYYLQIERFSHFDELSADNQIALQEVGPLRGLIFDRNNEVLAENRIRYQVRVNSDNAQLVLDNLDELKTNLVFASSAVEKLQKVAKSSVYAGEVVISDHLTQDQVIQFIDIQQDFPELVLDAKSYRNYPYKDNAAHLIGHVGRINPDDVTRLKRKGSWNLYLGSEYVGKRGVEVMYETRLHGNPGLREAYIDAHGRVLGAQQRVSPTKGNDLWLTLDFALQKVAEEQLKDKEGAVVAINPYDGAILALASSPRFDANAFIGGVTQAQWEHFNSKEAGTPMVHRAIYGQYAPGSTIKPFLALVALENGWRDMNYIYHSTGQFFLTPRHVFHDWKAGGHGDVDLPKSIIRSVNSFYYQLAHDVGVDAIHDALSVFGFGSKTGIDLDGERAGVLPTEQWKKDTFGEQWYPGDTIPIGVGQGYIEVTPLQQAQAMAMIANGGYPVKPYIVSRVGNIRLQPQPSTTPVFDEKNIAIVRDALAKVTQPGGTAYSRVGKDSLYPIAGKTGTAQVTKLRFTDSGRVKNEDMPKHLRDHAWFVGFAPAYNPRIVVAVIVEHGGSGGRAAGPVVRALMDEYLLNRMHMRFGVAIKEQPVDNSIASSL